MKYRNIINSIFSLLLVACSFTACIDDDFSINNCNPGALPEGFDNGYSLNVKITLDDMGGTRAANTPIQLKQWEDYIDPEKIRILFFDHEDKFLFESKSRWVKQLVDNQWLISVPIFTYGNDVYKEEDGGEWNWSRIREALTTNSFKIAILANRPEMEWYPGFSDLTLPKQWIDNTGPHWTPNDTGNRSIFDLHHCQYDPLYHAKSKSDGFYDIIMGGYYKNKEGNYDEGNYDNLKPQMGATSSWLDWSGTNVRNWIYYSNKGKPNQEIKPYVNYVLPGPDHPIPMYGIQRFEKINPKDWQEGTPFNLSDNIPGVKDDVDGNYKEYRKSIWLLRSVVKLELLIPKKFNSTTQTNVQVVSLSYPNPYARCEPMDIWTPTDELWKQQHNGRLLDPETNVECKDETAILNYGTICKSTDTDPSEKSTYQQRIGWLYGAWLDKNPATNKQWWFNKNAADRGDMEYNKPDGKKVSYPNFDDYPEGLSYPRIFNSCIQRNTSVLCDNSDVTSYYDEIIPDNEYYYYVVYTGERNVNDPSDLGRMGDDGGGKPTVQYWGVSLNGQYYAFPITDYNATGNPAIEINNHLEAGKTAKPSSKPSNETEVTLTQTYANQDYQKAVMAIEDPKLLPWPLIRNHVYTLKLKPKNDVKSTNIWNFTKGLSQETINNMTADKDNWTYEDGIYKNKNKIENALITANKLNVKETEGLKFTVTGKDCIQFYTSKLRVEKSSKITFLNVRKDCVITFIGKVAGTSNARGIKAGNKQQVSFISIGSNGGSVNGTYNNSDTHTFDANTSTTVTSRWKVTATNSSEITFELLSGGGLDFQEINVEYPNSTQNAPQKVNGNNNGDFIIETKDFYSKSLKVD